MALMVLMVEKIQTPIFGHSKSAMPVRCQLSKQQYGFTLLELLLVLSILAMAASLLVPVLSTLEGPSFNAQVREANNLLNFARRSAVVSGQVAGIEFVVTEQAGSGNEDRRQSSSSADNASDAETSSETDMTILRQWQGHEIELWYESDSSSLREIDDTLLIEFYPEGGSTGGDLIFRQSNRESLIQIDPFSGRVTVP